MLPAMNMICKSIFQNQSTSLTIFILVICTLEIQILKLVVSYKKLIISIIFRQTDNKSKKLIQGTKKYIYIALVLQDE